MRAGEWYKKFHPTDFRKQDYFFAWYYQRFMGNQEGKIESEKST